MGNISVCIVPDAGFVAGENNMGSAESTAPRKSQLKSCTGRTFLSESEVSNIRIEGKYIRNIKDELKNLKGYIIIIYLNYMKKRRQIFIVSILPAVLPSIKNM